MFPLAIRGSRCRRQLACNLGFIACSIKEKWMAANELVWDFPFERAQEYDAQLP